MTFQSQLVLSDPSTIMSSATSSPSRTRSDQILNHGSSLFTNLFGSPVTLGPPASMTWTPQSLTSTSAPFMYSSMVPTPGPIFLGAPSSNLGSGSVWLPARQFAPSAPATSYIGLQIDKGRLLRNNPVLSSQPSARLTLALTPAPSTGAGPLDAEVTVPSMVDFSFNTTTS